MLSAFDSLLECHPQQIDIKIDESGIGITDGRLVALVTSTHKYLCTTNHFIYVNRNAIEVHLSG